MTAMCERPTDTRPRTPSGARPIDRRRLLGLVAASTVVTPCGALLASPTRAVTRRDLHFQALRDGVPIGEHSVTFRPDGDHLVVTTRVEMTVNFLVFTLYHLKHDAEEVWRDGRLVRVESRTDDDGTLREVSGSAVDGGFLIHGGDGSYLASPELLTSNSLWDSRILSADRLIDIQFGGEVDLAIRQLDDAQVETSQGLVRARRHSLITPHYAGIFYHAEDGNWVKALIEAKGEIIEYVLGS